MSPLTVEIGIDVYSVVLESRVVLQLQVRSVDGSSAAFNETRVFDTLRVATSILVDTV